MTIGQNSRSEERHMQAEGWKGPLFSSRSVFSPKSTFWFNHSGAYYINEYIERDKEGREKERNCINGEERKRG